MQVEGDGIQQAVVAIQYSPAAGEGTEGVLSPAGGIAGRTGCLLTLNGSRFPSLPNDCCCSNVQ